MKLENKILNRLEIPLREGNYVFEKSSYREEVLSGILGKTEFDLILDEAGKIMADAINKKRENDEIKLPKFIKYMSYICIGLAAIYTTLLVIASNIDTGLSSVLIVCAVLCLFGAIFIAFGLSVYNFCRNVREFKPLEVFIKEDLDYFFDNINSKYEGVFEFVFIPGKNIVNLNIFKQSLMMDENIDITERRSLKKNPFDESELNDKSNRYLKHIEMTSFTK
jgi:hypothetical protein